MRRSAFTMIELIFVIVVMAILAKFGVEFLSQIYNSFILTKINNNLQTKSETAVEQIASRLQYRIKSSVIGRNPATGAFQSPAEINSSVASQYSVLEWVGVAQESFRGTTKPLWSGIIDIDASQASGASILVSLETNTTGINSIIANLRPTGSTTTLNDAALYFIGSDSNIKTGYGWNGTAITTQNEAMHPIHTNAILNEFVADSNLSGVDVYEYYQLSWTAYAVGITDYNASTNTGTLKLWYDYQPWEGETYDHNGTSVTLMENVSTFQYNVVGSLLKIQVCTKSTLDATGEGKYSVCKEKTVY